MVNSQLQWRDNTVDFWFQTGNILVCFCDFWVKILSAKIVREFFFQMVFFSNFRFSLISVKFLRSDTVIYDIIIEW